MGQGYDETLLAEVATQGSGSYRIASGGGVGASTQLIIAQPEAEPPAMPAG
jgi:hypothetical protein